MIEIEADFVADVRNELEGDLVGLGYPAVVATGDAYKDAHRVCMDHFNAFARRISQRARAVHWSAELTARESTLAPALRAGLAAATTELEAGQDVRPRLSRSLKDRDFDDKMLNDWGIHHLHLGVVIESDGFVARTGDVLFVMVRPDDVYLLDVRGHGAWTDADLVEIVHAQWPETLDAFRLNGVTGFDLTPRQRKNLRARNMNAGVTMKDGTFYAGIGGGLSASAMNFAAVRWGDMLLATAREVENAVRSFDPNKMADEVERVTGMRPARLIYRLVETHDDHALVTVENATKLFVIKVAYSGSVPA